MPLNINMGALTAYERRAVRRQNRLVNTDAATRPTDEEFLAAQLSNTLDVLVRDLINEERAGAEAITVGYLQATPLKRASRRSTRRRGGYLRKLTNKNA